MIVVCLAGVKKAQGDWTRSPSPRPLPLGEGEA